MWPLTGTLSASGYYNELEVNNIFYQYGTLRASVLSLATYLRSRKVFRLAVLECQHLFIPISRMF